MSLGESAFNKDATQDTATINYLTVSQVAVGGIASATDKDWYEVYLVSGVTYAAAWGGLAYGQNPALANATMTLRNASGVVQSVTKTAAPTTGTGGGIGFQVATSGLYYIEIDGTGASDVGTYLIRLGRTAFSDDYGSNFDDAGQIKPGQRVVGALQTAGDNDAFVLNVQAGNRYFYYVTTNVPDLAYTLDTTSLQRAGFGFLTNGQFGEVTATQTTSALLSVFSNSYVGAGSYSLFAERAYSTDRVLKIDTTGVNSYSGTTAAEEVWGFGGNDNFNGGGGNDILVGGIGDDTLNGGAGADRMIGGAGNDKYRIDNPGDVIEETAASGSVDTASVSLSYGLGRTARVETLQTTNAAGTGAINLTGNDFGQTILGNAGINILKGNGDIDTVKGGAGADKIYGGLGNDTLWGQAGKDGFYFDTAPNGTSNRDRIEDFSAVDDSILLKKSIFSPTGQIATVAAPTASTPAKIATSEFQIINGFTPGAAGQNGTASIIYDPSSGKIFYDKDAAGAAAAVHFATVDPGTVLGAADFLIFI